MINYWNIKFVGYLGSGIRFATAQQTLTLTTLDLCTHKIDKIIEQQMGCFKVVFQFYHDLFLSILNFTISKMIQYLLL